MDFLNESRELIAKTRESLADRRITLAEASQILTEAADVLVAAASFLGNSGEEKKRLVMAALAEVLMLVIPRLPMSVRLLFMVPQFRTALLEILSGVAEALYSIFKGSK